MAPVRMKLRLNLQHNDTCEETLPKKLSYRENLKRKRPGDYNALKEMDALRHREKRLRMTEEERKVSNQKARERMARMRQRRKDELATQAKTVHTRADQKKQSEQRRKWATAKRLQRARMSKEKRDELNDKRREKYQEEKMSILEMRLQALEKQKKLKEKEELMASMEAEVEIAEGEGQDKKSRSKAARRKSLQRARESISKDPQLFAEAICDLIEKASPQKKRALKREMKLHKKSKIPDIDKKTSKVDRIIASGVQKRLALLRGKRKKKDVKQRRLFLPSFRVLHKYGLERHACRMYGVSRHAVKKLSTKLGYKNPCSLPKNTKDLVQNYYKLHSVELPDQKQVSKKSLAKPLVLQMPIEQLYHGFRKDHPGVKIGRSSFFKLRPKNVKKVGSISFQGCLCEYCENIRLKLKVINTTCTTQQKPECRVKDVSTAAAITLCQKGEMKYNQLACTERKCSKCGVHIIRQHLAGLDQTCEVKWHKWELMKEKKTTRKGEKMVSRKVKTLKEGTLKELCEELEDELETFSSHLFVKQWQHEQFSLLTSGKVPEGMAVTVLDFAENFTCQSQNEIQSAYWSHEQITLHPIIAYTNCHNERCTQPLKPTIHSLVFISNDLVHDHHAVHFFSIKAIQHLKKEEELTKIVRYSDGCSAQYKSRGPFVDVSYSKEDVGLPIQHNYFASRHGKGPSDGESAVVKTMVSTAVKSEQASITNARDMFNYCEEQLTRSDKVNDHGQCIHFRRTFFYIPQEEICRDRQRQGKTLPGTRKVHSVETVRPGIVRKRNLSCSCHPCISGEGTCENQDYVHPWIEVQVQTEQQNNHLDDADSDPETALSHPSSPSAPRDDSDDERASSLLPSLSGSQVRVIAVTDEDSNPGRASSHLPSPSGSRVRVTVTVTDDSEPEEPSSPLSSISGSQVQSTGGLAVGVGDFVVVIYDDAWWVGEVVETKKDKLLVNFLVTKGDNKYCWPDKKETDWILKNGIFTTFPSPPVPVSIRYLGFDDAVYKSVSSRVQKFLAQEE